MATYYAVCNVNGPISRRIEADSVEGAIGVFEFADSQAWIDEPATDAEDDLDIAGDGMSEDEFAEALRAAGARSVRDLSEVMVGPCGTARPSHIADGWMLWEVE
jgi:hypothetical protein